MMIIIPAINDTRNPHVARAGGYTGVGGGAAMGIAVGGAGAVSGTPYAGAA